MTTPGGADEGDLHHAVNIPPARSNSARSVVSDAASKSSASSRDGESRGQPLENVASPGQNNISAAASPPPVITTPGGGGLPPSPAIKSPGGTERPETTGMLAYKHSREARKLIKKSAAASRRNLMAPSSGGTGGGGGGSSGGLEMADINSKGGDAASDSDSLRDFSRQSSFNVGGNVDTVNSKNGRIRMGSPVPGLDSSGNGAAASVTSTSKAPPTALTSLKVFCRMVTGKYLNILLLFMPFGLLSHILKWGPGPIFFLNFVTLIPLAAFLGDLTEEVADHMGDTIGGLLNASFGNAVEMVIGVQALVHNEIRVVQSSLLGSVLSNLLLVMGCCFLFGGIRYPEQKFNSTAAVANLSLLFLSTIALVVPTPIGQSYTLTQKEVLLISRAAALFLLAMYIQLLVFQMVTHKHLFTGEPSTGALGPDRVVGFTNTFTALPHQQTSAQQNIAAGASGGSVEGGVSVSEGGGEVVMVGGEEEEEEEEEEKLGLWASVIGLIVVTGIVAVFSEFLVASIDDVCITYNISKVFVGVILIPIVGNATEHMTAVSVAYKNRMELAMGIAVGSATQISVFVIPFLVIAGWIMGKPMTLSFTPVETVLLVMSEIITIPILTAGNSNWINGSLLITAYLFISFAVWHENDSLTAGTEGAAARRLMEAGAWEGL